ncbi:PREDICTED: CB1 cannabinoid receptor-interacting protein 1 [Galeopterus variegatus]|uniref:CB1 cannabinoid receptor-interacting protein 1 n=1 Tax=Galeopterus variegatus TaxID=482537 RepID=A0ABM0R624_GALVR|nr:PREDICTED: CB1 cannabinoid receptor-interacting protein 1 [Galeopterus variegatus]
MFMRPRASSPAESSKYPGYSGKGLELSSQKDYMVHHCVKAEVLKRIFFANSYHIWLTQVHYRNISIGGVLVPLELKSKEPDGDRIVYTGTYDTEGVAPTKSGERQPIQITMPFTDIGTFETVWQVKFYNYHKRDHCQWGSPFSVIEYECKPNETRSLMWVNKESFL